MIQTLSSSSLVVKMMEGDISNAAYCDSLYAEATATHLSVFHLGAVMSGDGERDFDRCMQVNLTGFINMVEGARKIQHNYGLPAPKFVFSSAGATIGSGHATDYVQRDDWISDASKATPHTTYGATKACCELLLSDYARRGFLDGRGVRLPTIVVRAGAPNAATTSCFSSVVREPLVGVVRNDNDGGMVAQTTAAAMPIGPNVPHAVTGTRHAIAAMLTIHDAPSHLIERILGFDRTVFLPAIAVSLGDLHEALLRVVTPESHDKLGSIVYQVDERLSAIVSGFPTRIDASRAMKLGIPPAPNAETLVREYMADFPNAIAPGIQMAAPSIPTSVLLVSADIKVAVVTGAGSGIGQAVAIRLSRGGWAVVLVGRHMNSLKETHAMLQEGPALCVKADVSVERDVDVLFQAAVERFGRVDLLFNNAGINTAAASLEKVKLTDLELVLKTNVHGVFLCAKAAMKVMAKNGGGRIINNGSLSAQVPRPGSACYTASKHAVLGLTKCIALDGRAGNVACGQIDFGNVVSEMSLRTNKVGIGALQPNGNMMVEPSMSLADAAETFWAMANLPLEANVFNMTVMATAMPFVGRG
jgi:D-erythronate 2-dehydrogenase